MPPDLQEAAERLETRRGADDIDTIEGLLELESVYGNRGFQYGGRKWLPAYRDVGSEAKRLADLSASGAWGQGEVLMTWPELQVAFIRDLVDAEQQHDLPWRKEQLRAAIGRSSSAACLGLGVACSSELAGGSGGASGEEGGVAQAAEGREGVAAGGPVHQDHCEKRRSHATVIVTLRGGIPASLTEFRRLGGGRAWMALDGQEEAGSVLVFGRTCNAVLEHLLPEMEVPESQRDHLRAFASRSRSEPAPAGFADGEGPELKWEPEGDATLFGAVSEPFGFNAARMLPENAFEALVSVVDATVGQQRQTSAWSPGSSGRIGALCTDQVRGEVFNAVTALLAPLTTALGFQPLVANLLYYPDAAGGRGRLAVALFGGVEVAAAGDCGIDCGEVVGLCAQSLGLTTIRDDVGGGKVADMAMLARDVLLYARARRACASIGASPYTFTDAATARGHAWERLWGRAEPYLDQFRMEYTEAHWAAGAAPTWRKGVDWKKYVHASAYTRVLFRKI
jgi:hypothetical protein